MSRSDAELLTQIAGGDVRAAGELCDRDSPALFPTAVEIVLDTSEAEDVLHDAFVALSERASQRRPERAAVIAWLVTLCRNLAFDRVRRRAVARVVIAHESPASVRDPERMTAEASEREKIRGALAWLPEGQRQTLEVAFFEGLGYPEIAARENVQLGTSKSRAARALSALREALVKEGVSTEAVGKAAG